MSVVADRLRSAMDEKNIDQKDLAARAGCTQGAVSQILLGNTHRSRFLPEIAEALGVDLKWLRGDSESRAAAAENPVKQTDPDIVEIQEIDLAYGMGGGTYLDLPVKAEPRSFSRTFLRNFTDAPPSRIFIARGMGDSMTPTILDSDIVLIDTAEVQPRMADKIWAMTYSGMGMIKRLRPTSDHGWTIMSDNGSVSDITAYDGEMSIVGRVVAIVRKV